MGRPRLDRGTEQKEPDLMTEHTGLFTLQDCPKCDSKALQPYKDSHGHWRCNCSVCGYWDCIVSNKPEEAAKKWQEMTGPSDR